MKIRRFSALVTTLLLMTVVGCSRQSAVTSFTPESKPSRNSPQIGDVAEYSLTGKAILSRGATAFSVTGHITYTVIAPSQQRELPSYIVRSFEIKEDHLQNVGGLGGSRRTAWTWLGEDASGNLYLLGESFDGKKWDLVTNSPLPLYMPADMKVGSAWGYAADFGNGGKESLASRCVGMERIKTPAGEYYAYKLSETVTRTGFPSVAGYIWVSPDLPHGFELKMEFSATDPALVTERVELVIILVSVKRAR